MSLSKVFQENIFLLLNMPIYCFKVMVTKEEAIFGNLPATHWKFTGRLGSLQATLYTLNTQLTRFGNSPVFPLQSDVYYRIVGSTLKSF